MPQSFHREEMPHVSEPPPVLALVLGVLKVVRRKRLERDAEHQEKWPASIGRGSVSSEIEREGGMERGRKRERERERERGRGKINSGIKLI